MPRTGSSLIAVAPVLRQSCMRTGSSPPGGEADRGSRFRRRAAQTPAGTPRCSRRPWLASGAGPEPGYELTVAHQHRRRQPPPGPRPATDAQAASDRMSDFAASPWCARSVMLTCFCPFAVDAAVFSYYGSTGTRGDRETIRPFGSSWSPSSSNTTPLHSRLQPWSG